MQKPHCAAKMRTRCLLTEGWRTVYMETSEGVEGTGDHAGPRPLLAADIDIAPFREVSRLATCSQTVSGVFSSLSGIMLASSPFSRNFAQ